MSFTVRSQFQIDVYRRWLRQISTIAWIKPSWKFTVYDVNSYLFAHTIVITVDLDQIECSAKLETKNDLGVYDISDKKVALLDYTGMSTSYTYLAHNIHRLLAVSYHFNCTSLQDLSSNLPSSFWFNWSYTFKGIALTSVPVSCLPHVSTPSISIFEKI